MTPFDNIKLLYMQLMNLTDEIYELNLKGEYNEASTKLKAKEVLIEKFLVVRNSLVLDNSQRAELETIAKDLRKKELKNIEHLKSLQTGYKEELRKINNILKVNNKYEGSTQTSGSMIDLIE